MVCSGAMTVVLSGSAVLRRCCERVTTNGFLWRVIAGSVVTRALKTLRNWLRAPACHAGATGADLRGRPAALVTPSEGGDDSPQPPAPPSKRLGIAGQQAAARCVGSVRSADKALDRSHPKSRPSFVVRKPRGGLLLGNRTFGVAHRRAAVPTARPSATIRGKGRGVRPLP